MSEVERVNTQTGEVTYSPWGETELGCPVFASEAYEEHVQEWINKEQEGKKVLWEMGAIASSLVGRCQGRHGDKALRSFAGEVGTTVRRVHQLADVHAFRVELESECGNRLLHLPQALTLKHFEVVNDLVYKRGGNLA